jgi:hypothetical protein
LAALSGASKPCGLRVVSRLLLFSGGHTDPEEDGVRSWEGLVAPRQETVLLMKIGYEEVAGLVHTQEQASPRTGTVVDESGATVIQL